MQLAQFRQRKAQNDAQNPVKKQKQKKKKKVANKGEEQLHRVTSKHQLQGNDARAERGPAGDGADFIIKRTLHSGDVIKQDQTFTIEVRTVHPVFIQSSKGFIDVQLETVSIPVSHWH